jgi:hypothetical protein
MSLLWSPTSPCRRMVSWWSSMSFKRMYDRGEVSIAVTKFERGGGPRDVAPGYHRMSENVWSLWGWFRCRQVQLHANGLTSQSAIRQQNKRESSMPGARGRHSMGLISLAIFASTWVTQQTGCRSTSDSPAGCIDLALTPTLIDKRVEVHYPNASENQGSRWHTSETDHCKVS